MAICTASSHHWLYSAKYFAGRDRLIRLQVMVQESFPNKNDWFADTLITYRSDSVGNDVPVAPGRSRWLDNDDDLQVSVLTMCFWRIDL